MNLTFKRYYYGKRSKLNKQLLNKLIEESCLDEPYTIFDDWFRQISVESYDFTKLNNVAMPFPDLLICQKPESGFALHLSGGIDSALLAFLYDSQAVDYIVGTVKGADDIEYTVAKAFHEYAKLKGRLHNVIISPNEAFAAAKEILPILKEPLMDPAVVLSYLVSKKARELGHNLVVAGDGADAAFGLTSFGKSGFRTLAIWKTIEPAEILGMSALLPYSLPDLQIWAGSTITDEQRKTKAVLRDFAKKIGVPKAAVEKRKMGWKGHSDWCRGQVYLSMRDEILKSPFLKLLDKDDDYVSDEKIFRQYSLIKWLEHNCGAEIDVSPRPPAYAIPSNINGSSHHRWTLLWIIKKCLLCAKEGRLPYIFTYNFDIFKYAFRAKLQIMLYNFKENLKKIFKMRSRRKKYLYASPVGKNGKEFLAKIIKAFGNEDFDYMIFVFEDVKFDEPVFKGCTFKYEKNLRWYFMKRYITPDFCGKYDYIFLWADDIDVEGFSLKNFISIMERNNLQMAQPALSKYSYYDIESVVKNNKYEIGRYVDYVEQMVSVFTRDAWSRYWGMMEEDSNFWGWGYPSLAKSFCKLSNMGIVDCETVTHTRPTSSKNTSAPKDRKLFLEKHKEYQVAKWMSFGKLK